MVFWLIAAAALAVVLALAWRHDRKHMGTVVGPRNHMNSGLEQSSALESDVRRVHGLGGPPS